MPTYSTNSFGIAGLCVGRSDGDAARTAVGAFLAQTGVAHPREHTKTKKGPSLRFLCCQPYVRWLLSENGLGRWISWNGERDRRDRQDAVASDGWTWNRQIICYETSGRKALR